MLLSATAAVIVVVVLKILGYDNPVAIAGGVAGAIAGALSKPFLIKKKRIEINCNICPAQSIKFTAF